MAQDKYGYDSTLSLEENVFELFKLKTYQKNDISNNKSEADVQILQSIADDVQSVCDELDALLEE